MSPTRIIGITVVASCALFCPLPAAQADLVPSAVAAAAPSSSLLSRRTAITAGVFLAAGLLYDYEFREEAQERRNGATNALAAVGNGFVDWRFILAGSSAGYLAGEIGGSDRLKETVLRVGLATAVATGVTAGLKYSIGRTRPHAGRGSFRLRPFSGLNSFPSGHTAVAFAIATAVADQTRDDWSDYALYSAATMTALARVNDDKHWISDVLIGGLIGHLSARWVSRQLGPVQIAPSAVSVSLPF